MKILATANNLLLFSILLITTTCYAAKKDNAFNECVNQASKNPEVVDGILKSKSTNKEWRLKKISKVYYDCGFLVEDEVLQQLFIDAGGNVLLLSTSVTEIGDIKFEMAIENLYIQLANTVAQIEKTNIMQKSY